VLWTPSIVILDSAGKERFRIEGYFPREQFAAQLEMGLARVAFMHKQWAEAERGYAKVKEKYADSASAAEAIYWAGVSYYQRTKDHTVLGRISQELAEKYPDSIWAEKASVWLPAAQQTKSA
jgi:outer membrane protein assembly factor BamD (BamD/ComL family)